MEAPAPFTLTSKPIEYKWDVESCTTLAEDAERYETEYNELFESDDADWTLYPLKRGKLLMRPLPNASRPAPVSKYIIDCNSPVKNAQELFAFLMTLEGFKLIDPDSDFTKTRDNPCQTFTYKGIGGYTSCVVTVFEALGNVKMTCPNAVWYDDKLMVAWPCPISKELRPLEAQPVEKEYHTACALRCKDVSPGVVRLEFIMYLDFALDDVVHKLMLEPFGERLDAFLAKDAPATGA